MVFRGCARRGRRPASYHTYLPHGRSGTHSGTEAHREWATRTIIRTSHCPLVCENISLGENLCT